MITPMLVQAYGAAFAIIVGSVVLGRAICALCGGKGRWWAAPVVGFAVLMILTGATIKLPGRGVTAAVACALAVLAAGAYLLKRGRSRLPWGDLVVGGASLLGASIPFLASGRVGAPGPTRDGDLATHLLMAEALRSARMAKIWGNPGGYPLGPHSIVATLGTAADLPLDMVFTGLLVATVALIGLTAANVLAKEDLWRRLVVGVLCSLTYLVAAYYAEGSFKEPIVAGLLLGFVLHLEQVRARWSEASAARRARLVIPAGLLAAAALYTYSYFALGWFGGTLAVWWLFETVARPALLRGLVSWRRLSAAAPWAGGLAVLAVAIVLPIEGQLKSVFSAAGLSPASSVAFAPGTQGNLPDPLSPYQALGIWPVQDFRYVNDTFHTGEGAALALGVLIFGLLWSLRRRELVLPAAAAAAGVIYWYTQRTQTPYVAAKALVIAAPVLMALGLRALLTRTRRDRSTEPVVLAVAAVFCGLAAYSSFLVLQDSPVQAPEPGRELAAFHRRIGDAKVLFLGIDDFAAWELRDSPVYSPASSSAYSLSGVSFTSTKPFSGLELDFDSIVPANLDSFRYVITTNTPYASQPPANFHLLERARLYELWARTGPTEPFASLDPSGQPGAILNCRSALGRRLRASGGQASVMATPVVAQGASLPAGQTAPMSIALPRGKWEISAEYVSYFDISFRAEGRRWTMPAYLGRSGAWFAVGEVTGRGTHSPVMVLETAVRPSPVATSNAASVVISEIAATRVPDTRRIVPLRDACGKYVDWYRSP